MTSWIKFGFKLPNHDGVAIRQWAGNVDGANYYRSSDTVILSMKCQILIQIHRTLIIGLFWFQKYETKPLYFMRPTFHIEICISIYLQSSKFIFCNSTHFLDLVWRRKIKYLLGSHLTLNVVTCPFDILFIWLRHSYVLTLSLNLYYLVISAIGILMWNTLKTAFHRLLMKIQLASIWAIISFNLHIKTMIFMKDLRQDAN